MAMGVEAWLGAIAGLRAQEVKETAALALRDGALQKVLAAWPAVPLVAPHQVIGMVQCQSGSVCAEVLAADTLLSKGSAVYCAQSIFDLRFLAQRAYGFYSVLLAQILG